MTDRDNNVSPSGQRTSAAVVTGALLVAAGVALLLDRSGALPASWRVSIWPVLLIGYGVARLSEPRRRGREGLFFVLAGAWWLAGTTGWLSMTLTWPLLIVAAGASLILKAFTAAPPGSRTASEHPMVDFERRHGAAGWLLPVIVLGAILTSGVDYRSFGSSAIADGELRAISIMGRRTMTVSATPLNSGRIVAIMGGSSIDFREATIAPGSTMTLDVFGLMGTEIITVPENWIVEIQATPVMGRIVDSHSLDDWGRRDRASGSSGGETSAPRLVVRGTVIMGRLVVRS